LGGWQKLTYRKQNSKLNTANPIVDRRQLREKLDLAAGHNFSGDLTHTLLQARKLEHPRRPLRRPAHTGLQGLAFLQIGSRDIVIRRFGNLSFASSPLPLALRGPHWKCSIIVPCSPAGITLLQDELVPALTPKKAS
jgi:hypothetical protein